MGRKSKKAKISRRQLRKADKALRSSVGPSRLTWAIQALSPLAAVALVAVAYHVRKSSLSCQAAPRAGKARGLVAEEGEKRRALLEEAGKRLASACTNVHLLERRARREGYRQCQEQVRMMQQCLKLLGTASYAEQVELVERWLDRESYILEEQMQQRLRGR